MKRLIPYLFLILACLAVPLGNGAGITTQMQAVSARRSAPAFVGPLDSYTTNLGIACSVARRLLASYTGALIRIRWDGGSAGEANIGYDSSGDLDTAAITSNVGANNAWVTTIYDQDGTPQNVVQTTSAQQPKIVTSGTLHTHEGVPTALFESSRDCFMTTNAAVSGAFFAISARFDSPVAYEGLLTSSSIYAIIMTDPPTGFFGNNLPNFNYRYTDGANEGNNTADTSTHVYSLTATSSTSDTWLIGTDRTIGGRYLDGPVTEFVIYSADPAFQHDVENAMMDLLGL